MTFEKKPHENLRTRLTKRAVKAMIQSGKPVGKLTDAQKKPPSQRKTELLHKKLDSRKSNAGAGKAVEVPIPDDCRGCTDTCPSNSLAKCHRNSIVVRCAQCGQKVRIRIIPGENWKYCPVCREGRV